MLHLKIIVIIVVILLWNVVWNIFKPAWMLLLKLLKKKYYHNTVNKLLNTQKNSKVYWLLLKIFLNNKKIPIIPPLFYENRFITDFKEKVQLFNVFFSKQRSLIPNNNFLPADVNYITDKLYLQLHFQPQILKKSFKILIQTKTMDVITYVSAC